MQPTNLICHPANSVCSFACTNLWWDVPVRWEIVRIYMDKSWYQIKSQNAQFWNIAISCNVALQRSQNWAVVAFLNLFTYLLTWRADCMERTMNERLSSKSVWWPVSAMSNASFFVVSLLLLLLLAWANDLSQHRRRCYKISNETFISCRILLQPSPIWSRKRCLS